MPNLRQQATKIVRARIKVVKPQKIGDSINFGEFMFIPKDHPLFTTLTCPQKVALKSIEEAWLKRVRASWNWKHQNHWSLRQESISARVEKYLFNKLKNNNNQRSIQNFIRKFLRSLDFRDEFRAVLSKQYFEDKHPKIVATDITELLESLQNIYPHVISGEVPKLEKELFVLYCNFISDFSVSYSTRVALIHFSNLSDESPIKKDETISILSDLIKNDYDGDLK